LDSLLEKEVLDDVAAYADELNEGNRVRPEKKKRVEQHHAWKAKHTKDIPGSDSKGAKFLVNPFHLFGTWDTPISSVAFPSIRFLPPVRFTRSPFFFSPVFCRFLLE